ncbi:hypothetical protein [Halocalculus aciditolerans]|uniref:Uncharacterized protein n=1 Tax=Halocalculus aciditolerans TaxID=1383812 RepID=A0A830F6Y8_9EURY|nr:hypothetical protein [Halocalculus aciditolerans]GGL69299.1 hypothetical protein GCM10009039_29090 [Halocalculus aciditolerans]
MSGSRDAVYEGEVSGRVARHGVEEFGFDVDTGVTVEYAFRVRSGPNADVVVVDAANMATWRAGTATSYYSHLSALDVRDASRSGSLPAGEYVVAVDNTAMGQARPPLTGSDDAAAVVFDLRYVVSR